MSNIHHPYFNNHSPSRFQQQTYSNTHAYKTPIIESHIEDGTSTNPSNTQQHHHYIQPPKTPSKLLPSTSQQESGVRATTALLASLDKSILQIR